MTDSQQLPDPPLPSEESLRITRSWTGSVRPCIYLHLLSVAALLCLTLADRGLLLNTTFSRAFFNAMQFIILPLVI